MKRALNPKATRDIVADYRAWHVVVNGGDSILEALGAHLTGVKA